MTLSVVIPAHNAAGTLAETLDSLLAQTRSDWRAIIVDDGSTDSTRRVAEEYVARDMRFSLLTHDGVPEGVSAARNRGVAAAGGRWLLFLDSDDTIEPSFVATMVGKLEANPGAKVVYCGSRLMTAEGRRGPSWIPSEVARSPFETLARQTLVVMHGAVIDRALVVALGGFDVTLRTYEDMDLFHRIARTGVAFLLVPLPLSIYRMRQGSLCTAARAMVADANVVIGRAFGVDPRVLHPAGRHASGADPANGSKEMAQGLNALSCAAIEIGQGRDGLGLVMSLPDAHGDLVERCRTTIETGLLFGARCLPGELPDDDPSFVARVEALLQEVERAARRPGLARQLRFTLEPQVFSPGNLSDRLAVGSTLLVRRDIAQLAPIAIDTGIDRVHVEFRNGRHLVGQIKAPALGDFSTRDVMGLALDSVSMTELLGAGGLYQRPAFWWHAALRMTQLGIDVVVAKMRRRAVPVRSLRALVKAALRDAALASMGTGVSAEREMTSLIAEGQAMAAQSAPPALPTTALPAVPVGSDRRAYWEEIYRTEDPWAYGSPYEQIKYRRTLDLLPSASIGRAIELACSEGRFTELLAPRVGHLIASDISETALGRARMRCQKASNIEYRRLDLFDDPLPQGLDLVVCSEVLYDLPDRAELRRVAARLAAMLAPGGHLLVAHAFVLKEDPTRTGYDWSSTFGAKAIAETLAATPDLTLERSLQTELYRIDLFRRLGAHEVAPTPSIEMVELGPPPEADHARSIVWGGAVAERSVVQVRETTGHIPILLYHRIAEDGPTGLARYRQTAAAFTEQMRWLRRHGYHSMTSGELLSHLAGGHAFSGRPVLISFDDAYRDFHDVAWPILRAHDFTAEVFVVTDLVGGKADWDAAYGSAARLMEWRQIQSLSAAGVCFGSHMASHSHMAELSSRQIVLEAARSRAALERALGLPCRSIAAPFGEGDERFVRIARRCGYEAGFTTEPGHAALGRDDALRLPRIEVPGGWSLDDFAGAVRPG